MNTSFVALIYNPIKIFASLSIRIHYLRFFLLAALLSCTLLTTATPLFAHRAAQNEKPALVTQEIRYHMPEAGEVFFVWGINGWSPVPEEIRPLGTTLKKVMRTPMLIRENFFTVSVQAPVGSTLEYGFLITKGRNSLTIQPVWDGDYDLTVTEDAVIELQAKLDLPQDHTSEDLDDLSFVTQEIRYQIPKAGEVFLLWGIDNWQPAPEQIRPDGTVIQNNIMYTPMKPEGDTFTVKLQAPVGATIDYGFLITKNDQGIDLDSIWQGNNDKDYHTVATQDRAIDIQASSSVIRKVTIEEPDIKLLRACLLFLTIICLPFIVIGIVRARNIYTQIDNQVIDLKANKLSALQVIFHPNQFLSIRNLLARLITGNFLKIALVTAIITFIGLTVVNHYGFSVDEPVQIQMVWDNLDLIIDQEPFQWEGEYYGPVFNLVAEVMFHFQKYLDKTFLTSDQPVSSSSSFKFEDRLLDRIQVKHPLTFLISLLAYISVAGFIGIFCGWKYAWFGPIILLLFPRFWGHSFFNPKDIPFAAMFIFSTYVGVYLLDHYAKAGNQLKIGLNSTTTFTILYGILVGLLTGIRIGGFILIFFVGLAYLIISIRKKNSYITFIYALSLYILMSIMWLLTTSLVHPASWANPIGWLIEAIIYQSDHPWAKDVLFDGRYIPAQNLPWYYLPKWLLITIPVIFQGSFVVGLFLIAARYRTLTTRQRAAVVLILLQIFFLPMVAMVKHSTIYDGMRQFLFILPAIAVISGISLIWLYEKLPRKNIRLVAITCLAIIFTQIGFEMWELHPYEYTYFNQLTGGLHGAYQDYETEYWGLSLREGIEWINKNSNAETQVVIGEPFYYSAKIFAAPHLTTIRSQDFDDKTNGLEPFYYLAAPKHKAQDFFPECKVIYQVIRQNTPFSIVKQCD